MRKLLLATILILSAIPGVALAAKPSASDVANAARLCKAQRESMPAGAFKLTYGTNENRSNAYGKCVSKLARLEQQNHQNAAKACRAEQQQSDSDFAASHDGKTFEQLYGTKNGRNAFGRCVSTKAKAASQEQQQATINAAKACRAEQKSSGFASTHDGKSFRDFYGTNETKSNAFGKCVSKKAKELQAQQ
jgi:hypothetical protein